MNQSLKAVIQLAGITGVIVTFMMWSEAETSTGIRIAQIVAPLVALGSAAILLKVGGKRDKYPDMLADDFDQYFERDGLCFVPVASGQHGMCTIDVFFQNRYTGDCRCDLVLDPSGLLKSKELSPVGVTINSPGAAVGVVRIPYSVPEELGGDDVSFKVAARTRYPTGRGRLVRFRDGLRVGSHNMTVSDLASRIGALAAGQILLSFPATVNISLPQGTGNPPNNAEIEQAILFEPGAEKRS